MQNYHETRAEMVARLVHALEHLPLNMIVRQLVSEYSNEALGNLVAWHESCTGEKEKGQM